MEVRNKQLCDDHQASMHTCLTVIDPSACTRRAFHASYVKTKGVGDDAAFCGTAILTT